MESKLVRILSGGIICAVGSGIETQEQARRVVEALVKGGMDCFELMRAVPNNTQLLSQLKAENPSLILGIGTVMDPEGADVAIRSGADFLVSPYVNTEVIRSCRRHNVVSCFGALTPTEIVLGWEAGLDLVKVFPADAMGGPSYFRTLKGPLSHARLVGAGGVTLEDVDAYFAAGAALVAVDEDLMPPDAIRTGDYSRLTELARLYRATLDARPAR